MCLNQPLTKGYQRAAALGSVLTIQAIKHQLPAPIHERCLNDFIIRDAHVRLQNGRQGYLCWRNRRVPTEARCIERRQFLLKSVVKQLMAVIAEKDKLLRSFDVCDDGLLTGRWFHRRMPG
jgi:hypothetical protein